MSAASSSVTPALLQPDNHNKKYESLFVEIDSGQIKLPMFQREFVWDKERSAKLIDSILKGYPIGTFIFWKTRDSLRSYKNLGNHVLPETPKGDYAQYILDGQQRMTSLYAIRKGIRLTKDGKEIDYRDIYIDLDFSTTRDEQIVVTEKEDGRRYVSVHSVLTQPLGDFYKSIPHSDADKIQQYKTALTSYDFSSITIKDYPIDIACEVFTRINTGGKELTVFEIMVAKTYDEAAGFDLAEQYNLLLEGNDDDDQCLQNAKFDTIPSAIIMQCVAALVLKAVRGRDILQIPRQRFIENWLPMKNALFAAVDFVRSELRIPVSQLLPYPAIMVPLTYYFHKTGGRKPSNSKARLLEQFFYWVGVNGRYSSASESSIAEDLQRMELIAEGGTPSYFASEVVVTPSDIAELTFQTSNSFCKTILCLLAFQQPKSLDTNGVVILDNSNLKIGSSKNYHHFFPKAYLQKADRDAQPNLMANITLIDGFSNKHRIGKKAPGAYTATFAKTNKHLVETLKTHLIDDRDKFGISANDYSVFIAERSKAISIALDEKLSPKV